MQKGQKDYEEIKARRSNERIGAFTVKEILFAKETNICDFLQSIVKIALFCYSAIDR